MRRDTNTLRRNDMVMEITDQNFEAEVLKSAKPVLVDFWAPWCGPCRMVAPIIDELSTKYEGKFKFCKLNVDENKTTATQYRVMSIPTLLFFKGGQVADMVVGAVPESALSQKIDQLIQK
ncbi:MAG: thioredoxin [Dehalococcoides mccartyi]